MIASASALPAVRALKVSGPREEVRFTGLGFHDRNEIADGTVWAAERLAVAYLDAKAQGASRGTASARHRPGGWTMKAYVL